MGNTLTPVYVLCQVIMWIAHMSHASQFELLKLIYNYRKEL